jgi:hypothetical protein
MGGIVRKQRYQIMQTEFVDTLSPYQFDRMRGLQGTLPLKHMVTISLPYLDVESGVLWNGICCSGCNIFSEELTRID